MKSNQESWALTRTAFVSFISALRNVAAARCSFGRPENPPCFQSASAYSVLRHVFEPARQSGAARCFGLGLYRTIMDWQKSCTAVIPCLNEESTIGPLVAGVRCYVQTVLVVDDGSRDQTASAARQAGAEVLRQEIPRGKGAALQTGWQHARQRGFPWALTLDGDGQHSPEDIPAFFRCAEQTSAALVVGNRMAATGCMPWLRRVVNRWMSRRLSNLAGHPLPDSQCGFRLLNLEAWSTLPITTTHFEIESEVLLAFIRTGYHVEFVPIRTIYKAEQSKIHPWQDTLRWLRWWRQARKK